MTSAMAANLPNEVNKFCANLAKIRRSLDETKSSFNDITAHGNTGAEFSPKSLLEEVERNLEWKLTKSPAIVVLGQTCWAKAYVINELFNKQVLPSGEHLDDTVSWRMIHFKYGKRQTVGLSLPGSYELVDNLAAYNRSWTTVPLEDLELRQNEKSDPANQSAILEISLNNPLLSSGASVIMSPCNHQGGAMEVFESCTNDVLPVIIYAIGNEQLTQKDQQELSEIDKDKPIFFIHVPQVLPEQDLDLTESGRHAKSDSFNEKLNSSMSSVSQSLRSLDGPGSIRHLEGAAGHAFQSHPSSLTLFQQLCSLGFVSMLPRNSELQAGDEEGMFSVESELVEDFQDFPNFLLFMRRVLQCHLVNITSELHEVHDRCLRDFILYAFDMQRDMMITPKRLEFAKEKESELYATLNDIASKKQAEIKDLIAETFYSIREELLQRAVDYDFIGAEITESGQAKTAKDLKICTGQIQGLMLGKLNAAVGGKLVESVNILRDSFTGTLGRCLDCLEKADKDHSESAATEALAQILNAAYKVDISVRAGSSLARILLEKMKQLIQAMPWSQTPKIDDEWKKKVATDMLNSLSEAKLAKSICAQFKDRLKHSHDAFNAALKQLEMKHNGRLERTEEQRLKIRKFHAPTVAKLALESISLRDYLLHGMPQMGREIGRGQYGVVYSCDVWAGCSPCAVKTVVPPDEKHWNDLALEFYYTKNVPEHERVVNLRGSVIDSNYGGGPAVLLIMDRLTRDLYSAIRTGLDWPSRLRVAIDVVEGMRFLHSQGLVHRDIKLKNVLLDKKNRGKITDLGFCKPEAMMSGSIVGTPIHMAPELFSGNYDNSVDVYAFGILFWYVCAGSVKLPYSFEQCASKDQLWSAVKRGVRPEKLAHFDEECWELMQACWLGQSNRRPLLGVVEPQLLGILERFSKGNAHGPMRAAKSAALRNLHAVTSDL